MRLLIVALPPCMLQRGVLRVVCRSWHVSPVANATWCGSVAWSATGTAVSWCCRAAARSRRVDGRPPTVSMGGAAYMSVVAVVVMPMGRRIGRASRLKSGVATASAVPVVSPDCAPRCLTTASLAAHRCRHRICCLSCHGPCIATRT